MRSQPFAVLAGLVLMSTAVGCGVETAAAEQPVEAAPPAEIDTDDEPVCAEFQQPGCVHTGCPEGQVCQKGIECVPSLCRCDEETGQSICSLNCDGGTCVDASRACPRPACRILCTFGLETDDNGCEICECKPAPRCGCSSDDDCTKVVAGCCPCNLGGTELAIAKDCADRIAQCPIPPEKVPCFAFDWCTDKRAACVAGECTLQNPL